MIYSIIKNLTILLTLTHSFQLALTANLSIPLNQTYATYLWNLTSCQESGCVDPVFSPLPRFTSKSLQGYTDNVPLRKLFTVMLVYNDEEDVNLTNFFSDLVSWMVQPNILTLIPVNFSDFPAPHLVFQEPYKATSSSLSQCNRFYDCLFYSSSTLSTSVRDLYSGPDGFPPFVSDGFQNTIQNTPLDSGFTSKCVTGVSESSNVHPLRCPLSISEVAGTAASCFLSTNKMIQDDWAYHNVDFELDHMKLAGPDTSGIWWPRLHISQDENPPFTNAMGRQFLGDDGFQCSIESKCSGGLDCQRVGSRIVLGLGSQLWPSPWSLLVLTALENISTQLNNQYVALKGAAIGAALTTFKIQDFYPGPPDHLGLFDILQGLAFAFAFLGGFAPSFTETLLSDSSAAIGAIGGYLNRHVSNSTALLTTQEKYAESVAKIYTGLIEGLDSLSEPLFNGSKIWGDFNITQMLKGGAWAEYRSLQRVSDIEEQMRIEIVSQSINGLWKTAPSNKTFVLFVDLGDTVGSSANCKADSSGPPAFKFCGDGGVYYAYNFVEDGDGTGHLDWPWGAKIMNETLNINPAWITEASARTYRLARADPSFDQFNFSIPNGIDSYLKLLLRTNTPIDLENYAGRSPGSWTLPVCDASTWGTSWNVDYTKRQMQKFPCFCGPGGTETQDWANAAGMYNFHTFYETCKQQLIDKKTYNFTWPENVSYVDLGMGKRIQRPKGQ